MVLILDIGNTAVKYAVYKNSMCQHLGLVRPDYKESLRLLKTKYAIKKVFYSDVRGDFTTLIATIFPTEKTQNLHNENLVYPYQNAYKTPKTLGTDRKALVAAAFFKYPNQACLIIDLGSCITFDFIDAEGVYHGGAISPGIGMRYRALQAQTGKLPLLDPEPTSAVLGTTTTEAIHSGVYTGVLAEVSYQIDFYRANNAQLRVILTGGDHEWLSKSIKKPIFAEPNFLMEGMHTLLQYNTNS
ncbi:MAG: type III pantothenate kinase [Flavobacteriaceae bacterium]|nr:type III pantothenate kinase [Flavobacteriaceae bacterium]